MPLGIEDDHESLWGILSGADGYELEGEERIEFVRRCLRSLLDAGAVPVDHMPFGSPIVFAPTDRFGTTRDAIVEAVIAHWLASGGGDLEWGDYPFTFEENFDPYGWTDEPAPDRPIGIGERIRWRDRPLLK